MIFLIRVLTKKRRKHAFESKLEDIYDIKIQNGMTCIHENEVNIMAQYNLLHDIINNSKRTKKLKIHYSPI